MSYSKDRTRKKMNLKRNSVESNFPVRLIKPLSILTLTTFAVVLSIYQLFFSQKILVSDATGAARFCSDYIKRKKAEPFIAPNNLVGRILFMIREPIDPDYYRVRAISPVPCASFEKPASNLPEKSPREWIVLYPLAANLAFEFDVDEFGRIQGQHLNVDIYQTALRLFKEKRSGYFRWPESAIKRVRSEY